MNIIGLIVEYNPIHNGHLYQIQKINEIFKDNIKIAVMSGDYVQRGEPAIFNKNIRTKMALMSGIDILLELPPFYSTQSAEIFSKGAILSLNSFFCNFLVFGSESANIDYLNRLKEISLSSEFEKKLKKELKNKQSYANSYFNALSSFNIEPPKSNDILALEYIKAIDFYKNSHQMKIFPIKREKTGYYDIAKENFISASELRKLIKEKKDFFKYINKDIIYLYDNEKSVCLEDFYKLIRYNILYNNNLTEIADIELGLENRLKREALKYNEFNDFFNAVLNKRITITRLQRILVHILCNITKKDTEYVVNNLPFIRVLGMSKKGQKYFNSIKNLENFEKNKIFSTAKNISKKLNGIDLELWKKNKNASEVYKIIKNYKDEFILEK